MKKKISLLAVALLAIGLTACGNSGGVSEDKIRSWIEGLK